MCPTCKKVPAVCKCHRTEVTPWRRQGGMPEGYTDSAVLTHQRQSEKAEARRQQRTILPNTRRRNKASSRRERDLQTRRFG